MNTALARHARRGRTWRSIAFGIALGATHFVLPSATLADSPKLAWPAIHGHLRYNFFAYPDLDQGDQTIENFFELEVRARGKLGASLSYNIETLLVADDVQFTAGGFSLRNEEVRRPYFSLVSAVLVYRPLDGLRLSAGKQIFNWSIMDEVQPANLMAPADQSDIFRQVEQGVYSLAAHMQRDSYYVDLAVVPVMFTPVRLPQGRWNIVGGGADQAKDLPDVAWDETQAGLRLGGQFGELEFTLMGYVGRDWAAVFVPKLTFVGGEDPLELQIIDRYPRTRSGGVNASYALGESAIARVETMYFSSPEDFRDNFFLTALGGEYLWGNWLFTGTYLRFDRTAAASQEVTDRGERSFFRSFLSGEANYDGGGRWRARALVGYDIDERFLLSQMEVSTTLLRDLRAGLRGELIAAWGEGYFYRIRNEDRLGFELTYSF